MENYEFFNNENVIKNKNEKINKKNMWGVWCIGKEKDLKLEIL